MQDGELERILKAIQEALQKSSPDQKVNIGQNGNIFSINRKPKENKQFYIAPDLSNARDWLEKFDKRDPNNLHAFKEGEYVVLEGIIDKRNDKYYLHTDNDPRQMDFFKIDSNNTESKIVDLVAQPIKAIIKINSQVKKDFQVSDIQEYTCNLTHIIKSASKNPSIDEINKMKKNERVVIEGEFLEYTKNKHDEFVKSLGHPEESFVFNEGNLGSTMVKEGEDYPYGDFEILDQNGKKKRYVLPKINENQLLDKNTKGLIKTSEGKIIEINYSWFRTRFNGGEFENINGKTPITGDIIRINPSIDENYNLEASECDPCHLLSPSKKRLEILVQTQKVFEEKITDSIEKIKSENYSSVRKNLSELNKIDLNNNQRKILENVIKVLPKNERPMLISKKDNWGKERILELDFEYGISIESMTRNEFKEYVGDIWSLEIPEIAIKDGGTADMTNFYCLMDKEQFNFTKKEKEIVMEKNITGFLNKIRKQKKSPFYDRYSLESSLNYLAGLGNSSSTKKFFSYFKDFIKHNEYVPKNKKSNKRIDYNDHIFNAFQTLEMYKKYMPKDILKKERNYIEIVGEEISKKEWRGDMLPPYTKNILDYIDKED